MSQPTPPKRIGFAERDEAVAQLQQHHAEGRLDSDEFQERMTQALQARTVDDLQPLFVDLPRTPAVGQRSTSSSQALVSPSSSSPGGLGELGDLDDSSHAPVLPAGEPGYLSALRLAGWLLIPVGLVLMIMGVTWWVFFTGLFFAPAITAIAESLARKRREERQQLQQHHQRKELL